jgi:hypothetical protein
MMKTRYLAIAAVAIVGAIGLAACGGNDEPASQPSPPPAEPVVDTGGAEGTMPAGQPLTADQFVGMTLEQASAFAEEAGRQWRIVREDGEDLPATADFVEGRVSFTVEDGVVTEATIEEEDA